MSASNDRFTTPPPTSEIRQPPAPTKGIFNDNWEPYAPRKSTRLTAKQARQRAMTPPLPAVTHESLIDLKANDFNDMSSAPLSSFTTVSNNRTGKHHFLGRGTRQVSGALSEQSVTDASSVLGVTQHSTEADDMETKLIKKPVNGMLPTPSKTPRKRPSESKAKTSSIARNLFFTGPDQRDELMPTPKRGRNKYSEYNLDSFGANDDSNDIQIYTDSHERIPEIDTSADNPFYGTNIAPEPTKKAKKPALINVPGEGLMSLEEASQRDDGDVMVFRGKRIYRLHKDLESRKATHDTQTGDPNTTTLDTALDATVPAHLRTLAGAATPRLLFPSSEQIAAKELRNKKREVAKELRLQKKPEITINEDEEALTDIEEHSDSDTSMSQDDDGGVRLTYLEDGTLVTPSDDGPLITPTAPRFAPFSPPTTARVTRSKKIDEAGSSPMRPIMSYDGAGDEPDVDSPTRPFTGWKRTKLNYGKLNSKAHGTKRGGDTLTTESGKKQRGGKATH